MKAAIFHGAHPPLTIADVEIDTPMEQGVRRLVRAPAPELAPFRPARLLANASA